MILIDGNDNTIEYHEIHDQHFFKCELGDSCLFRIEIVFQYTLTDRKRRNCYYRLFGYLQHNHTIEALESNNTELQKSNLMKMEERMAGLRKN